MDSKQTISDEAKAKIPVMELDTAIVILLPSDGTSVMVDGSVTLPNTVTKRVATWDDAYRMVCDAKSQMEAMRMSSHHISRIKSLSQQVQAEKDKKAGLVLPGGRA